MQPLIQYNGSKIKTSADPFVGKRPIAEQKNPAYKHRISNQTLFKIHTFCCFEIKFDQKYLCKPIFYNN